MSSWTTSPTSRTPSSGIPGRSRAPATTTARCARASTWHNVSKIAGVSTELTYTLEKRTSDSVVFVGRNDSATSTDTITAVPADGGTELTYRADLEFSGAAKLGAPIAKLVFEKIGSDTEKQLTEVLNGLI